MMSMGRIHDRYAGLQHRSIPVLCTPNEDKTAIIQTERYIYP
jgi:hypothetical protein